MAFVVTRFVWPAVTLETQDSDKTVQGVITSHQSLLWHVAHQIQ